MVGGHTQRFTVSDLHEPAQEPPRCVLVALLAEHRVDELAVAVDRPVEVAPAAGDLHVGLVDVPGAARATTARPS